QKRSMENLARHIIRASFSQERMSYLPVEVSAKTGHRESGQVECRSKDGSEIKAFDALEWMAAMCRHIPGKGEQMARYRACPPLAELLSQCFSRKTQKGHDR
ncbi:hypothetical protein ACFL0M_09550, partial [Thermodesulfobacteriota bacterium]